MCLLGRTTKLKFGEVQELFKKLQNSILQKFLALNYQETRIPKCLTNLKCFERKVSPNRK